MFFTGTYRNILNNIFNSYCFVRFGFFACEFTQVGCPFTSVLLSIFFTVTQPGATNVKKERKKKKIEINDHKRKHIAFSLQTYRTARKTQRLLYAGWQLKGGNHVCAVLWSGLIGSLPSLIPITCMADSPIAFAPKRKRRPEKTKENGDLRHEEKKTSDALYSISFFFLFICSWKLLLLGPSHRR